MQDAGKDVITSDGDACTRIPSVSGIVNVGGRRGSCPAASGPAAAAAASPLRGMFKARRQGVPWHQLQFIPTLDPATGRPAILVNESVITALKEVQSVAEWDTSGMLSKCTLRLCFKRLMICFQ